MRIVKLSEDIFQDIHSVINFFTNELINRIPKGKFRITKGRISNEGLQPNEKLLFSYNGMIYFKAISTSGRCDNLDDYSSEYPYYFLIDTDSLKSVRVSLNEFENEYHKISNDLKSIVQSQGWPIIANTEYSNILWNFVK